MHHTSESPMSSPAIQKEPLTLEGHHNSVNVLRFSQDAERLLSGDQSGYIIVWDMHRAAPSQTIDATHLGPVTSLAWVRLPDAHNNGGSAAFAVGFGTGFVGIWKAPDESKGRFEHLKIIEAHEGPVEAFSFDRIHYRLASAGAGYPQVWSLELSSFLERLSPEPRRANPYTCSGVHFTDLGENLLVTYVETHSVMKYQVSPWQHKSTKVTQTRIGFSLLDGDALFVSNLSNGVDLYSADSLQRIRHFEYTPRVNAVFPVCLARQASDWVVIGGDDGKVRVFDRNTGDSVLQMDHGSCGLVQIVQAASTHDQDLIAAAATEVGKKSKIKIWYTKQSFARRHKIHSLIYSATSISTIRCLTIAVTIFFIAAMTLVLFTIFYYMVYLPIFLPAFRSFIPSVPSSAVSIPTSPVSTLKRPLTSPISTSKRALTTASVIYIGPEPA